MKFQVVIEEEAEREFAAAVGTSLMEPHAELPGLNHFEVAETLAKPDCGLGLTALNLIRV